MNYFFILTCVLAALSVINAATVNKEVTRTIDASTSIVKIVTDIKITGATKEYIYTLPNEVARHVAFIGGKAKGSKVALEVSAPQSANNKDYTNYLFTLDGANSTPTIKIVTILTEYLEPFPAEITQNENQLMKLTDSHYLYSQYPTTSQRTKVKLASSMIESYTRKVPHSSKGAEINFGPYTDIPPEAHSSCIVHFLNHEPFAKLNTVQTDIEVSHWGSISIEEVIEMEHKGATLKGGFSRFEYQMRRNENVPSFRSNLAVLPGVATDIFYRDQIGNISTSELRRIDGEIELDIQPRFPMFGGWKTQFYIGYRMPTESMITVDSDTGRYKMTFDFWTVFEDVWIGDLEVKLVLPEGCSDVQVTLPANSAVTNSEWTRRYTYLDSKLNGGRPVLILSGKNIVAEVDSEVVVTYSFEANRILVEPITLCLSFFAMFCVFSFIARTSSIDRYAPVSIVKIANDKE